MLPAFIPSFLLLMREAFFFFFSCILKQRASNRNLIYRPVMFEGKDDYNNKSLLADKTPQLYDL